ncbi:glycosyltransferase family 4 protein [uncultured Tenacibaculum sp.]|uniref:glycosyltransferase family 4 protein n=1 Tax=uncultured Tenacibaculum sp. TaxID=174713 RepID=UPI0026280A70|nr:glycosyltransferase family 4 protein [uncultured Tenacibaculum sp.]
MDNKKTICFFNSTRTWGGGEKWHYEMSSYLFSKRIKVLVIVSPNSELQNKVNTVGIPYEEIKVSNFSYLNSKKIANVATFLKNHNVSTIVMNSSEDMKLGGLAAKKANVNRIIYRRGSAIPIKNSFINRYFFKNILDEVLANSEATKATINAKNGHLFPKDKITVIPNAINIEKFDSMPSEELYMRQNNEIILGNLGRLVYQKNQEFLIDVALELKKRSLNFKLFIGGDGKLGDILSQKIKTHNLEREVTLLGFIENPKSFMNSLDVFLLPSRWEGFGYVLAEAMLCEKPAIAFNISSNGQIIEDKENGFLLPFDDVQHFSDKIEFFINNKAMMTVMGKKGRKKIEEEFSSALIQEKVKEYLLP